MEAPAPCPRPARELLSLPRAGRWDQDGASVLIQGGMGMRIFMGPRPTEYARRRTARGPGLALAAAAVMSALVVVGSAAGGEPAGGTSSLVQVSRTVAQDQGAWVIDYRLRHKGPAGVVIAPEEIGARVEGWVSNSRVASHGVPRRSTLAVEHGPDFTAVCDVIAAVERGAPVPRAADRLGVGRGPLPVPVADGVRREGAAGGGGQGARLCGRHHARLGPRRRSRPAARPGGADGRPAAVAAARRAGACSPAPGAPACTLRRI